MKRAFDIYPTVEEMAEEFCELDSEDQARFFALVSEGMDSWSGDTRGMQIFYIAQEMKAAGDQCGIDWIRELAGDLE